MKLSVIALDYDGTIARGDVLDPVGARRDRGRPRRRASSCCWSPARILDELRRVAATCTSSMAWSPRTAPSFISRTAAHLGAGAVDSRRLRRRTAAPRHSRSAPDNAWSTPTRTRRRGCWRSFARSNCRSSSSSIAAA